MSNIVPLHCLPEEVLNKQIFDLGDWLQGVLSLRGDESMKRLEILLPQIKKTAKGISITEIKHAFDLYLDNKLNIEPRDNYLTLILFNKVIKEYKDRLPKKTIKIKEVQVSEDEQNYIMTEAIKKGKKEWLEKGIIENASSRYDWLVNNGQLQESLKLSDEEFKTLKIDTYERMKAILAGIYKSKKAIGYDDKQKIKNALQDIKSKKSGLVVMASKEEILKQYYEM